METETIEKKDVQEFKALLEESFKKNSIKKSHKKKQIVAKPFVVRVSACCKHVPLCATMCNM